jgi:hypothetical protein
VEIVPLAHPFCRRSGVLGGQYSIGPKLNSGQLPVSSFPKFLAIFFH